MSHRRYICFVMVFAAGFMSGCAAVPQQDAANPVRVCDAAHCEAAKHSHSTEQLLAGFQQLLKVNKGEKVTICNSNPKTQACESVGVCYFVLGGIIPGNGCARSIVFNEVTTGASMGSGGQISLKANMPLTFIWTPVICASMTGALAVRSANDISFDFESYYCNWMVVGNMTATFKFVVESVDLTQGQVGGYWSHGVKGTGIGKGAGYALLQFPKAMPAEVNGLVEQPVSAVQSAKASGAAP